MHSRFVPRRRFFVGSCLSKGNYGSQINSIFHAKHGKTFSLLVLFGVSFGPSIEHLRAGSITNLGFHARPYGVSNGGTVVVGDVYQQTFPFGGYMNLAVLWTTDAGLTFLGEGAMRAVTPDGSIAVGMRNGGVFQTGAPQPLRWTPETGAEVLELPTGVTTAGAFDISPDGSIIAIESGFCGAGGCSVGGDGTQFYRWTESTGSVPIGYGGGWGRGISNDGSVVVGINPGPQAFRWDAAAGPINLGTLNGDADAHAHAVSADGSVVVGTSGGRAFRWTEFTGMVDLGPGEAFDVSPDGSIIVGRRDGDQLYGEAFYCIGSPIP